MNHRRRHSRAHARDPQPAGLTALSADRTSPRFVDDHADARQSEQPVALGNARTRHALATRVRSDQLALGPRPALTPHDAFSLQPALGNSVIARMLHIQRQPAPPTPLTPTAARGAVTATTRRGLDVDSIRFVESLVGATPDGSFTAADAQLVAQAEQSSGVTATGEIGRPLVDLLLRVTTNPNLAPRSALIHLVADVESLDVSAALAVVFDPTLRTASARDVAPGGVATIRLGPTGFTNSQTMVTEIQKQLAVQAAATPVTAVPATVLSSAAQQRDAIAFNRSKLNDRRSIRMVQGFTGAVVTGSWDRDAVRHVALHQQSNGRTANGKLDAASFEALVAALIQQSHQNAALHLIVDYFGLNAAHTFALRFEPTQKVLPSGSRPNAETSRPTPGVGTGGVVVIFPSGMAQPFAGLVHTVAHELGHIDQVFRGISDDHTREFLSEGIEIESSGMAEEILETPTEITGMFFQTGPPAVLGFFDDANTMLREWFQMPMPEKRKHVARFRQLRRLILARIAARRTSAAQRQALAPFIQMLNAADQGV